MTTIIELEKRITKLEKKHREHIHHIHTAFYPWEKDAETTSPRSAAPKGDVSY